MARSARPAGLLLTLLTLLISTAPAAFGRCFDEDAVFLNLTETETAMQLIKSDVSATVSEAILSGEETSTTLDISVYFDVEHTGNGVYLIPKDTLRGVTDYPINKIIGEGTCNITCGSTSTVFPVNVTIRDENTASPRLSAVRYTTQVVESDPEGWVIDGLVITASDYDKDANNHELTFSLDGSSTFSLSPATLASAWPPTYTTRLVLTRSLDWSQMPEYSLTVTATDPGGKKATSDVIIAVLDVDNKQPEFNHSEYTVESFNPKAVGPLEVSPEGISATDPDIGGPLTHSLIDPSESWARFFDLNADTAVLSLVKEIPVDAETPAAISFLVEAKETSGEQFVSRTALVVHLKQDPPVSDEGSEVGYIVGLVLLSVALVAALAALVWSRRGRQPAEAGGSESGWRPTPAPRTDPSASPAPRLPPRQSPPPPLPAPPPYEKRPHKPELPAKPGKVPGTSGRRTDGAPAPPGPKPSRERLCPDPTSRPPRSGQPISNGHVYPAQPMGVAGKSAPPISARFGGGREEGNERITKRSGAVEQDRGSGKKEEDDGSDNDSML